MREELMGITISGTGSSLIDFLYNDINFQSNTMRRYLSRVPGDGGLSPGRLVFTDDFRRFSGLDFRDALKEITGNRKPDRIGLGGPAIIALINCAQLIRDLDLRIKFYGVRGRDETGALIERVIRDTTVEIENYKIVADISPYTYVLSDPSYEGGMGERLFVNNIGAAWNFTDKDLTDDFFSSDILFFGGTAIVPEIHRNLSALLKRGKEMGAINIVTTVYDFLNEQRVPGRPWPLADEFSLGLIDLLIVDREEALRISDQHDIASALEWFLQKGIKSIIITNGAEDIHFFSTGSLFKKEISATLPASLAVKEELAAGTISGDTTGCGDNFSGGVLASLIEQLLTSTDRPLDMREACAWGICSGGFTCSHIGGYYAEKYRGEKRKRVEMYYQEYLRQTGDRAER